MKPETKVDKFVDNHVGEATASEALMTPSEARELARALLRLADDLEGAMEPTGECCEC